MSDINLEQIKKSEIDFFRQMIGDYWRELMPNSPVVQDPAVGEKYFNERYQWDGGNNHPEWIIHEEERVGFVMYRLVEDKKLAWIHDFYIVPGHRRKGYGSEVINNLLNKYDQLEIQQIDLSVRPDNPTALEFWKAQGFYTALYRMRQYRGDE